MSSNPFPTDPAHLSSLVTVISDAVKVIVAEYAAVGQVVPSLDSTQPGPLDAPENVSLGLSKAIRVIEAACAQLSFTVASPGHVVANKCYGFEEPACMLVICNAKIADLLLDKPDGLHVSELAKKSGLDEGKMGRILRLLATKHCFNEVKPNVFANNRLSIKLLSTDPVHGLVGHITDEIHKSSVLLHDVLSDPRTAFSYRPEDSAFMRAHRSTVFNYYDLSENKERHDRFAQAMIGWGQVTGKGMLPKAYPWEDLAVDTNICDVGGGNGHITLDLVKAHPHLKVVLQDLPAVIEQGRDLWTEELPSAINTSRVEFIPLDFLNDVPVKGCNFYYIRHVLHDWPDAECSRILANICKAMLPSSRLLIHEFALQHVARQEAKQVSIDQAPEPLLPNYGMGSVRLYQQDINMMTVFNSKERTLTEFVELSEKAGLKFVKLWDSGESSLIEFSLV